MEAIDAIRGKRDTRAYLPDDVNPDVLDRVLDAARMAGSAKNIQPVRLVVVTDQATKEGLKASGDFAAWIDNAPVVVVATVHVNAGPRRLFDVGRHLQNLMIAAHDAGLASCPVTIHRPEVASELLGVPAEYEPVMIVTLGGRAEGGEAPPQIASPRVAMSDYVARERWT